MKRLAADVAGSEWSNGNPYYVYELVPEVGYL